MNQEKIGKFIKNGVFFYIFDKVMFQANPIEK